MPVVTLYRHGVTGGVPPMKNDHQRVPRGEVAGWSPSAARRNTQFLYSVQEDQLDGCGYAVTLTLRDCPPDSETWRGLRRAFEKRMKRAGMIRMHWVTEWQRRGVPHLHGAIWFPDSLSRGKVQAVVLDAWLSLAEPWGVGLRGQDVRAITGTVGWFQYLSKHAARGVRHYQRCSENVPASWRMRTGRVWGKVGDWPVRPTVRLNLQDQHGDGGWFAYRRMVRGWRLADARASGEPYRLRSARGMLRCPDPALSRVRGVSEWIPEAVTLAMAANLAGRGYSVTS